MSTLYIVATPIGNMEDITLRAIRVLKEVDLIAAEDTRETRKLLARYGISTPVVSYYEHNEREKAPVLVEILKTGKNIALTSDAGTPGISDPGYRLVKLALKENIPVVPIPGPSALTSILSVAGLPMDEFTFKGFIPAKPQQRKKFLRELGNNPSTFIFYESARRLKQTLEDIRELLEGSEIAIGRELTKLYEEIIRGDVGGVIGALKGREVKGEVTVVLRTKKAGAEGKNSEAELRRLLSAGIPLNDAAKAVAKEFGLPKSSVY
ncbi:MAG: 16S rRNA (cytidine(1402)-2'-O)-methyltransferase, partial [Deltaproteobacteria bacterium]|nr:16S rRNA (cytidine(1402)-2'-O)-methyltransferase [Deltaproteobacteria bacterium]